MRPTRIYRTIRGEKTNYKVSFYTTEERRDAAAQRDATKDGQDVLCEQWFPDVDQGPLNQGWALVGVVKPATSVERRCIVEGHKFGESFREVSPCYRMEHDRLYFEGRIANPPSERWQATITKITFEERTVSNWMPVSPTKE